MKSNAMPQQYKKAPLAGLIEALADAQPQGCPPAVHYHLQGCNINTGHNQTIGSPEALAALAATIAKQATTIGDLTATIERMAQQLAEARAQLAALK